jgi:hypothetical protein
MAFYFDNRLPALLLVTAALACGPKSDGDTDDAGDETNGGTTTTGEALTDSDSDPTAPTATAGTAATATATGGTTASTSATSTSTTTSAGSGEDTTATATTVGTSATSATDTGDDTGIDPPPVIPCEGDAAPLVGITTTIGYLQSQVPPRPDTTGTGGSSSGGGELDPGTLFVKLSDQNFTCAEPNALLECGQHWSVTIVIPPEFQSPGVFNLLGQDVRGFASETGAGAGEDCSFGGGSFDATFQILAIDDQTVEGRLCNVNGLFFDTDPQLEGSFSAARCPS